VEFPNSAEKLHRVRNIPRKHPGLLLLLLGSFIFVVDVAVDLCPVEWNCTNFIPRLCVTNFTHFLGRCILVVEPCCGILITLFNIVVSRRPTVAIFVFMREYVFVIDGFVHSEGMSGVRGRSLHHWEKHLR
jgi:hypothetical protein